MTLPQFLPDWVPWWAELALLVVLLLFAGAFLLMPFSVFGTKARLEAVDERLDEIETTLRTLAHRLPDLEMRNPAVWRRGAPDEDGYVPPPARGYVAPAPRPEGHASPRAETYVPPPPPIPPAPVVPEREMERDRLGGPPPAVRSGRSEPQLRWPDNRPR